MRSVVIAVRSGLFRFGGPPLSDTQVNALWALVGSGLAASAAVVAALLTKAHNDRLLALSAQESRRLNLDTAIASLNLLRHDGGYSPPAVIAGGLTTLIHLGHPTIAMRALSAASKDGVVDPWTMCWIIGQALRPAAGEPWGSLLPVQASAMLLERSAGLATEARTVGEVPWPDCLTADWPRGLPDVAAVNCIAALVVGLTDSVPRYRAAALVTAQQGIASVPADRLLERVRAWNQAGPPGTAR